MKSVDVLVSWARLLNCVQDSGTREFVSRVSFWRAPGRTVVAMDLQTLMVHVERGLKRVKGSGGGSRPILLSVCFATSECRFVTAVRLFSWRLVSLTRLICSAHSSAWTQKLG